VVTRSAGGGAPVVSLDDALLVPIEPGNDLVALDEALTALASVDARKSQVVEMRFFGGLSIDETAEALQVSRDTVKARLENGEALAAARVERRGQR
jgi:DNA-directed RNA polymerase specialized sigma24 family protein